MKFCNYCKKEVEPVIRINSAASNSMFAFLMFFEHFSVWLAYRVFNRYSSKLYCPICGGQSFKATYKKPSSAIMDKLFKSLSRVGRYGYMFLILCGVLIAFAVDSTIDKTREITRPTTLNEIELPVGLAAQAQEKAQRDIQNTIVLAEQDPPHILNNVWCEQREAQSRKSRRNFMVFEVGMPEFMYNYLTPQVDATLRIFNDNIATVDNTPKIFRQNGVDMAVQQYKQEMTNAGINLLNVQPAQGVMILK